MAAALAAQMAPSYRLVSYRRPGRGGPGDPAGVREPRRPYPTGGAGAAELPVDPSPPGMARRYWTAVPPPPDSPADVIATTAPPPKLQRVLV